MTSEVTDGWMDVSCHFRFFVRSAAPIDFAMFSRDYEVQGPSG